MKQADRTRFRPGEPLRFYIIIIALAIFIFGVQLGIKQGRTLQLEEIRIEYDYNFPN